VKSGHSEIQKRPQGGTGSAEYLSSITNSPNELCNARCVTAVCVAIGPFTERDAVGKRSVVRYETHWGSAMALGNQRKHKRCGDHENQVYQQYSTNLALGAYCKG